MEEKEKIKIGQRLKKFADSFESLAEFGRKFNKDRTFFTPYFRGLSIPGGEILKRLSELGCDINWLLTGESKLQKESFVYVSDNNIEYTSSLTEEIKFKIEAAIPAGIAEMKEMQSENTEDLYFDPRYHFYLKIDEENGYSMKPVIQPGDLVLVSLNAKVRDNDLVAARWEDGRKGAVKIYKERGNQVVLLSYNQTVDPIFLEKNKVHAYRVMLIRKMK